MSETSCPEKNSLKLRWRRARTVARNRDSAILFSAMKRGPGRRLFTILHEWSRLVLTGEDVMSPTKETLQNTNFKLNPISLRLGWSPPGSGARPNRHRR